MSAGGLIAALGLPPAALVGQRVPKKLLLEHHGAPTAADKRLVAEGIDAIHWLAALKPANCGVPDYRDGTREYLEIAVLRLGLRSGTREARLVELLHRAVPYPVVLVVEAGPAVSLSLAHKRAALIHARVPRVACSAFAGLGTLGAAGIGLFVVEGGTRDCVVQDETAP